MDEAVLDMAHRNRVSHLSEFLSKCLQDQNSTDLIFSVG